MTDLPLDAQSNRDAATECQPISQMRNYRYPSICNNLQHGIVNSKQETERRKSASVFRLGLVPQGKNSNDVGDEHSG